MGPFVLSKTLGTGATGKTRLCVSRGLAFLFFSRLVPTGALSRSADREYGRLASPQSCAVGVGRAIAGSELAFLAGFFPFFFFFFLFFFSFFCSHRFVLSAGKVKLGFHRDSGFKVAIKIISKNALQSRPAMQQKLEREIAIMKFLDHPNVLRLYDVYDTPNYLFLVLEHVEGGELFDYLLSKGKLDDAEALRFFQQLVDGVEYCHSHLICHRDL